MMEKLTDDLYDEAMSVINEVEELGGMTEAINSGMAKLRIEESATKKQARIDTQEDVVVGVNKYRLEDEDIVDVLSIDNEAVRISQVDRINETKKNRDEDRAQAALDALKKAGALEESTSDGNHPSNLLALAVEAAKARCTVGEISDALEHTWGR
jgi:methylmalonyl-CoA mutase